MTLSTTRRIKSTVSLIGIDALLIPLGIAILSAITDNTVAVDAQLGVWFGVGSLTYILIRTALYQIVASVLNWLAVRNAPATVRSVSDDENKPALI